MKMAKHVSDSLSSPGTPGSIKTRHFSDSEISLIESQTDAVRAVAGNLTHSLKIVICLTVVVILIEFVTGTFARADCLIIDSFVMAGEFVSLVVAYACMGKANDSRFDYVTYEIVAGFFISICLTATTYTTLIGVFSRLMNPEPTKQPFLVLLVGIVGVLQNITSYLLVGRYRRTGGDHHHKSTNDLPQLFRNFRRFGAADSSSTVTFIDSVEDLTQMEVDFPFTGKTRSKSHLLSDLIEHDTGKAETKRKGLDTEVFGYFISDLLGSSVSITSALISIVFSNYDIVIHIDPILSLLFSCWIGFGAVRGVVEGYQSIKRRSPMNQLDTIVNKDKLLKIPGVNKIVDVEVVKIAPKVLVANLKIEFSSPQAYENARLSIKSYFHNRGIHSTTIQPIF